MTEDTRARPLIGAAVLASGAAVLAVVIGAAGVTTTAIPLLVGGTAVVAGIAGRLANVLASGLVLTGWALGLLAAVEGSLPANREGATVSVGLAAGFLLAVVATRRLGRPELVAIAGLTALVAGFGYYFAFQFPPLAGWPFWAAIVVLWAAWEAVAPRLSRRG